MQTWTLIFLCVPISAITESCEAGEEGCCAEGWTGEYCDEQIIPQQHIKNISRSLHEDSLSTVVNRQPIGMYGAIPVASHVERHDWDEFESTEDIFNTFKPLVLSNSPADEWPARGGGGAPPWSKKYLLDRLGPQTIFPTYRLDEKKEFLYYSQSLAKELKKSRSKYKTPTYFVNPTLEELFDLFERGAPMYHHAGISKNNPFWKLVREQETSPSEAFVLGSPSQAEMENQQNTFGRLLPRKATRAIWFGPAGIKSLPHYDMSDNFYVQVFGHKTFYLATPTKFAPWYTFPFSHPSSRHSQFEWPLKESIADQYPLARQQIVLLQADLGPGDVLYIPAMWWHATESQDINLGIAHMNDHRRVFEDQIVAGASAGCNSKRVIKNKFDTAEAKVVLVQAMLDVLHVNGYAGDEARDGNMPLQAGPKLLAALVAQAGRFQVQGSECAKPRKLIKPSKWIRGLQPDPLPGHLKCLNNPSTRLQQLVTKNQIRPALRARMAAPFLEGMAEGVLSKAFTCHFFQEIHGLFGKDGLST